MINNKHTLYPLRPHTSTQLFLPNPFWNLPRLVFQDGSDVLFIITLFAGETALRGDFMTSFKVCSAGGWEKQRNLLVLTVTQMPPVD